MTITKKGNLIIIFGLSSVLLVLLLSFSFLVSFFPILYVMIFTMVILVPIIITICYFIVKEIKISRNEKDRELSRSMLHLKIRKFLYFIPIAAFFVSWWVDIGVAISYLLNQDIYILSWAFNWPQLTDHYLIYTNSFSSFFFGCYSWSIITYYLGTKKLKDFKRRIKSIILWYPFWFGICGYLGIVGSQSYRNGWISLHIIFGIWVSLGSIIAIFIVLSSLGAKSPVPGWTLKQKIPRLKSIKLMDFLERFQAICFILIILTIGAFFSILLWENFTNVALLSILWNLLTIILIILLNFLFSMKNKNIQDVVEI